MEIDSTYLRDQANKKERRNLVKFVAYVALTIATAGGLRLLIGEGADCLVLLVASIPPAVAVARRSRL